MTPIALPGRTTTGRHQATAHKQVSSSREREGDVDIYISCFLKNWKEVDTVTCRSYSLHLLSFPVWKTCVCGVFSGSCLWLMEQELGAADVERRLAICCPVCARLRILVENMQELVQVRQQCSCCWAPVCLGAAPKTFRLTTYSAVKSLDFDRFVNNARNRFSSGT